MAMRFHVQTGGSTPHRPAAGQERRAHHGPGAGGRARRRPRACTPTRSTRRSALPTPATARLALRTQQVLPHESGVDRDRSTRSAGSYYVETLTDADRARGAGRARRDRRSRWHARRLEAGYQQDAIGDAAYEAQRAIEAGERIVVGRQRLHRGGRRAAARAPGDRPGRRRRARWSAPAPCARRRDPAGGRGAGRRSSRGRAARRTCCRGSAACVEAERDARRDQRRAARRVGRAPAVSIGSDPPRRDRRALASTRRCRATRALRLRAGGAADDFAPQRVRLCFLPTGPEPAAQARAGRADRRRERRRALPGRARRGRPSRLPR